MLKGENGYAGEVGFSIINTENIGFEVENKGFLEKYASVTSIRNAAISEIKNGNKTLIMELAEKIGRASCRERV